MPVTGTTNSVRDLLNETAWQQSRDALLARNISYSDEATRNVGGIMGKDSFLMLLSAQLRHQDPLNPQSDSDFAAQLAQFSALEQMQNMNETLTAMSSYQSYSLIGKYVIAGAMVDGEYMEIPGMVESVFKRDGRTFAQIGDFVVPISSITDVFDNATMVTPEILIQTSNNLIGRTVKAQIGDVLLEGVVTRVMVDKGFMYALVDDGENEPKFVPVGSIYDIRQTGTPGTIEPKETLPVDPPDDDDDDDDKTGPVDEKDPADDKNPVDDEEPIDDKDPVDNKDPADETDP